jgi:hypothetical protein
MVVFAEYVPFGDAVLLKAPAGENVTLLVAFPRTLDSSISVLLDSDSLDDIWAPFDRALFDGTRLVDMTTTVSIGEIVSVRGKLGTGEGRERVLPNGVASAVLLTDTLDSELVSDNHELLFVDWTKLLARITVECDGCMVCEKVPLSDGCIPSGSAFVAFGCIVPEMLPFEGKIVKLRESPLVKVTMEFDSCMV